VARKRPATRKEEDLLDRPVGGVGELVPGPRRHRPARDPREPLPVGVIEEEPVALTGVATKIDPVAMEKRSSENIATFYARALVAYEGDVAKALATVFGISREEAELNMVELHERARSSSRANTSVSDMFERHDLTSEVRLAKLREMLFSPTPAVALKAIDMLGDLDATSKAKRMGTTWESFVQRVRAGAGPKAQAAAGRRTAKSE